MANRNNEWVKRRRNQLLEEFGAKCRDCAKTWDLEFAHLAPTGLKGEGRGKSRRLANILKHRDKYALLCVDCHDVLDGMRRYRQQDFFTHRLGSR